MAASGTEGPAKPGSWRAKAEQVAAPAPAPADPVRIHAEAFVEAYGEHLNHHCARCTNAWKKLRDALDAAPPV